ncbi:MAG: hypothetical protein JXR97_16535 [Planctomycetes bacterium]|nr:hypothetical protein [Planctomycetota bacterium]
MKSIAAILLCLVLASCAVTNPTASDPIDKLVTSLNASNGMWINGLALNIDLPASASPDVIFAAAIKLVGFDEGHIKTYRIQEVREVKLNTGQTESYSAALVDTDLGRKVFLFKREINNRWWARVYDAEE